MTPQHESKKLCFAERTQLSCPHDRLRIQYQDETRPELIVQVTNKGKKTYYCRCWNPAKGYTDKVYVGKFAAISLEDARSGQEK